MATVLVGSAASGAPHALTGSYAFWVLHKKANMDESYEKAIKNIGTFDTVEDFWKHYNFLRRPNDIADPVDLHLFRTGIKPMWEDPANKNGGKWVIRLRKGLASRCWENLLLAVVGGMYQCTSGICGVVCSVKYQDDLISVWTRNAQDEGNKAGVKEMIKTVLDITSGSAHLEYRAHDQAMRQVYQRRERSAFHHE